MYIRSGLQAALRDWVRPLVLLVRVFSLARGRVLARVMVLASLLAILAGCRMGGPAADEPGMRLPVSHNNVMVALINDAADPIWAAAWREPSSEVQWGELEKLGNRLQIGGALLLVPGTGPMDQQWAASPDWREYAKRLNLAGAQASQAAKERDVALIAAVGDEIVEVCEACHTRFKPMLPTGGLYGRPSPNAVDYENRPD